MTYNLLSCHRKLIRSLDGFKLYYTILLVKDKGKPDSHATTLPEHVINVSKAVLNLVPFVGGPLGSLAGDYLPNKRIERLNTWIEEVAEEVKRIEGNISEDYVKSDEFEFLFTSCAQRVTTEYQILKRQVYKNVLLNALVSDPGQIDAARNERYLQVLSQLTTIHIELLSVFVDGNRNRQMLRDRGFDDSFVSNSHGQMIHTFFPHISYDVMSASFHDLDQFGITNGLRQALKGMVTDSRPEDIPRWLTPFGKGFVSFITDPNEPVDAT